MYVYIYILLKFLGFSHPEITAEVNLPAKKEETIIRYAHKIIGDKRLKYDRN